LYDDIFGEDGNIIGFNSVLPSIENDICSSTFQSAIISNEFENESMIMHNNDDSQVVLLNNNFVQTNPIDEKNTLLSDQLKIQNFANDLMINSLNKINEENGSANIYDAVFNDDKNIASFANSCDKYLIVEVAINTGKEKMHEQNVSLLRKASLKYLAIKISEKMNETNLDTENFDLTNYFKTLCKTMSDVFKHIIDAGCKRLDIFNNLQQQRNRLIANKNKMILRLKNLAVDIEETVSRTLYKLNREHYNKKNFYLNAMENVIKEHSKRFKQSKYENDKNAIDNEITFVKEIVNNYCHYYDIKKNIIITTSSSSSSDNKKRKNNKSEENTDDEIEQKKERKK
jgi:hypothetical protein